MVISSKEQHYVDKFGPVAPPENQVFCNIDSQIHCPNHWNNLTRVSESSKQKRCEKCEEGYHISSLRAFKHHSQQNNCIAANIEQLQLDNGLSYLFEPELKLSEEDFVRYEVDGVD